MTSTRTPSHTGRTVVLTTVTGVVLATVSALGATAQAAPAPAAPSTATPNYLGDAYGTTVNIGNVVKSGRSAPVVLGCGSKAGISKTNGSAGLALAPLAKSGTVATTAMTTTSPLQSATTARTEQVSLLGGLVSATAIEAASSTTLSGGDFSTSPAGTTFANLTIGTQKVSATPAANTRIDLPGLGYVVLNEQKVTNTAKGASLDVNALHLVVTQKNLLLGATAGVNVVISHARSGLTAPVNGVLGGASYGTKVTVGSVVSSGSTFLRPMPCTGTNGKLKTNTGVGVPLPQLLTLGVITDTAKGTANATTATGETTSTVAATNLLAGVLKATVIKADATATKTGGKRTFSDGGSSFGSLSVQGHPEINGNNVAANTQIVLPGLGTLYLHRVIRTGNKIEVRMVELVLSSPNAGLPAGADLRVAVAAASVN